MTTVFASMSMSMDGFTAGPGDGAAHPLGVGGERLHAWMSAGGTDAGIAREMFERAGAVVIGRRMYDIGRAVWGGNAFDPLPMLVVTSRGADPGDEGWATLVSDGVGPAIEQATAVAGGQDVWVAGGANVVRQCISLGLLDELQLTLVPTFLGAGTRLFDALAMDGIRLEQTRVIVGRDVAHLRHRVVRS